MVKWCHFSELPPMVIPNREIERMRDSIYERERNKEECQSMAEAREASVLPEAFRIELHNQELA